MENWFDSAKLGIFMHWGIYSVKGVTESWSFYRGEISYDDYMAQKSGFTAENYDPEKWAELFCEAGAKYTVLTTKHHDGFALWDTKASDLKADRDLISPYCNAMRDCGMKVGLYFSHLDWSHPDYPSLHPSYEGEDWCTSPYTAPKGEDDYVRWENFLKFHKTQLTELLTNFGKIDLLWFDGAWERTQEQWKFKEMREYIRSLSPETIVNDRIGTYGDYKCPEQAVPVNPPKGPWELCITMNNHWGWCESDTDYKPLRNIIRIFTECLGGGGNLLLDIGPKPDGTIGDMHRNTLLGLGKWIKKHEEAVYPTKRGLPAGLFHGATTLSADNKTIYLYYYDRPMGELALKGIKNNIKRISVVGHADSGLNFKVSGKFLDIPGIVWITLPEKYIDPNCTVIKVDLEDEVDLYLGKGGGIGD